MSDANGNQEKIGAHGEAIDMLKARMTRMELKLDAIGTTLSEARGGWKTLLLVGGAAGAAGAIIGKLLPFLSSVKS